MTVKLMMYAAPPVRLDFWLDESNLRSNLAFICGDMIDRWLFLAVYKGV